MTAPWQPEVEIELEQVRVLVDRDHPELRGRPITVVGEGWDNLAVRVGDVVFRFARRALAARLLENELRWMPVLAPRLPVATSAPIGVGRPSELRYPYGVHPWLAGVTADRAELGEDERCALAPAIGAFLGALHGLPVPDDAPPDLLGRGDHAGRGHRARERLAALGERVDLDGIELPRGAARVWVHGDLYARHLVLDPGHRGLVGVIDWGDVHAGAPETDLSIAYSFVPPEGRAALFAAYGREVDGDTRRRARLIAFDYAGALIPYGRSVGDPVAEALGWQVLRTARAG